MYMLYVESPPPFLAIFFKDRHSYLSSFFSLGPGGGGGVVHADIS